MRVLVSGGCGFVGLHLARRLADAGHLPTSLDALLPQVHRDPSAARRAFPGPVVVGDVADRSAWASAWQASLGRGGPPEAVVHLAAETGTGQSMYEPERYHHANVEGSRRAVEAAAAAGVPIVVVSSRAVYGEGDPVRASTEADPHRPVSVYGETKSLAESAVAAVATPAGLPLTIVRPQNVLGAGQAVHNPYTGVLAAFVARLREGRPLQVYGDGRQTRDLVHVEDLTTLLAWCLAQPPDPDDGPRVLNCGSGRRTTLRDLATLVADHAPVPPTGVEHVDVERAGDIRHACADLTRLHALGAPLPERTAADGVADFVDWAWRQPPVAAAAWDAALAEVTRRAGPARRVDAEG